MKATSRRFNEIIFNHIYIEMYILTRSYPPPFFSFRVITKAHNAVDDNSYTIAQGVTSTRPLLLLIWETEQDVSRETKKRIYCRFGSTAHYVSSHLMLSLTPSQSSTDVFFIPVRCVTASIGLKDTRTKMGWRRPEEKPRSPSGSDSSDRPGDLLEQRATGGRQSSKLGGVWVRVGDKLAFAVAAHQAALMD